MWFPFFMSFDDFDVGRYHEAMDGFDLLFLMSHHVTHSPQV
jgi:hypothetical protein